MAWFLLDLFLDWFPAVFLAGTLVLSAVFYFSKKNLTSKFFKLIIAVVSFRIFYAVALTLVQYYVWSQSELTKILTQSPLSDSVPLPVFDFIFSGRLGYFLFYSYGRFWLNAVVSIFAAFCFYLFLKTLKKRKERFFESGETELGFLAALIVGWPNFVVFLLLVFVLVILISIFRGIFLKEAYTALGWPFILTTLIVLFFGDNLIQSLDFGVLRI